MLSIRLHHRFECLKFRLNAVITKSLFILMLDSEGYFLAINVVGRSCPHRIEKNVSCRTTCQFHVFVCVFFPSILDIKFVGRTSRGHTGGRSHRIFNPPSFCGACLDFCREKDSAIPFPRRP